MFEVRRVILELKIDPKSFEEEQKQPPSITNEKGEALSAPQSVQNHDLSVLSTFWSASRRRGALQGISGQLRGDPPEDTTYQRIFVYLEV